MLPTYDPQRLLTDQRSPLKKWAAQHANLSHFQEGGFIPAGPRAPDLIAAMGRTAVERFIPFGHQHDIYPLVKSFDAVHEATVKEVKVHFIPSRRDDLIDLISRPRSPTAVLVMHADIVDRVERNIWAMLGLDVARHWPRRPPTRVRELLASDDPRQRKRGRRLLARGGR